MNILPLEKVEQAKLWKISLSKNNQLYGKQ